VQQIAQPGKPLAPRCELLTARPTMGSGEARLLTLVAAGHRLVNPVAVRRCCTAALGVELIGPLPQPRRGVPTSTLSSDNTGDRWWSLVVLGCRLTAWGRPDHGLTARARWPSPTYALRVRRDLLVVVVPALVDLLLMSADVRRRSSAWLLGWLLLLADPDVEVVSGSDPFALAQFSERASIPRNLQNGMHSHWH
jgi:hypothetical protein